MVLANDTIQKKHKGLKKNGAMINCSFCHTKNAIPKTKGYSMTKINASKSCQGRGCHPLK